MRLYVALSVEFEQQKHVILNKEPGKETLASKKSVRKLIIYPIQYIV